MQLSWFPKVWFVIAPKDLSRLFGFPLFCDIEWLKLYDFRCQGLCSLCKAKRAEENFFSYMISVWFLGNVCIFCTQATKCCRIIICNYWGCFDAFLIQVFHHWHNNIRLHTLSTACKISSAIMGNYCWIYLNLPLFRTPDKIWTVQHNWEPYLSQLQS